MTIRQQTPYGTPRGTNPTWVNPKGFVDGDIDPTGLVKIGARQYDQTLGRFISVDPVMDLADPQQWNAYAYNSPISHDHRCPAQWSAVQRSPGPAYPALA